VSSSIEILDRTTEMLSGPAWQSLQMGPSGGSHLLHKTKEGRSRTGGSQGDNGNGRTRPARPLLLLDARDLHSFEILFSLGTDRGLGGLQ